MDDNIDDLADVLGLPITQMANRIVDRDKNRVKRQPVIPESTISEDSGQSQRLIIERERSYIYEKIKIKRQIRTADRL